MDAKPDTSVQQAMRTAVFLIAATLCAPLYGQENAYVDARAGSQPEPKIDSGSASGGGMGCSDGCTPHEPLTVTLIKMIGIDIPPARGGWTIQTTEKEQKERAADVLDARKRMRTVEWTARIANATPETIWFPTSLSWSNDAQQSADGRTVLRLSVGIFVKCLREGSHGGLELLGGVALYGAVDHSADVVPIEPGHWLTVVGVGPACPSPAHTSDEYKLTVHVEKAIWNQKSGEKHEDSILVIGFQESPIVNWNGEGIWAPGGTH